MSTKQLMLLKLSCWLKKWQLLTYWSICVPKIHILRNNRIMAWIFQGTFWGWHLRIIPRNSQVLLSSLGGATSLVKKTSNLQQQQKMVSNFGHGGIYNRWSLSILVHQLYYRVVTLVSQQVTDVTNKQI